MSDVIAGAIVGVEYVHPLKRQDFRLKLYRRVRAMASSGARGAES